VRRGRRCAALPTELLESELFGFERGAFTGAAGRKLGLFEVADGGTLFLDEIGELPAALQPTLLGVLERKKFRRVGGKVDLGTDVRVVSATNRDLRAEVNAGRFRLDLFYRLAVLRIDVPALRERLEDVPVLVDHFLAQLGGAPRQIPLDLMQRLKTHSWPGNIRELENLVERLVRGPDRLHLVAGLSQEAGEHTPLRLVVVYHQNEPLSHALSPLPLPRAGARSWSCPPRAVSPPRSSRRERSRSAA